MDCKQTGTQVTIITNVVIDGHYYMEIIIEITSLTYTNDVNTRAEQ